MDNTQISGTNPIPQVTMSNGQVQLDGITIDDAVVVGHLMALPSDQRAGEVCKALAVGVRGLVTMTAGASVEAIGSEIERVLAAVTHEAETRVEAILSAGGEALRDEFDPERRTSLTARTIDEVSAVHRGLLDQLDPKHRDSHVGKLITELTSLLGPGGLLAQRLDETFDVAASDSAMAHLVAAMEGRFQEIRDLMIGAERRDEEAERGTAKGVRFEDATESRLREEAGRLGGCIVERTARTPGRLSADAVVGDLTVTLDGGTTVVVEVKNTARIDLTGAGGILGELDRAMTNRDADWAVCVSRHAAYPGEVGTFGVYGNRILIADDEDGTLLRVALRWIDAAETAGQSADGGIDREAVAGRLDRIQELAGHFGRTKRALTSVRRGVDDIKTEIDDLRTQLLDLVADARVALTATEGPPSTIRVA